MGVPKIDGWFMRDNLTKMDDLGVALFQETIYMGFRFVMGVAQITPSARWMNGESFMENPTK